ncbi:cysteine-rich repeat secretory protein 38-like [Fagus crenata]
MVLLDSLSTKASQNYSFYNESSNIGIYGLFLCRGDVSNNTCQSFLGEAQTWPRVLAWNVHNWNSTSPDDTNFGARSLMNGLIDEAIKKKKDVLFRADNETVSDGSEERYGLVQCSRDINRSACSNCFRLLMDATDICCESKLGWRILSPSCNLRYENYSFFQQEPAMPSPTQPPPELWSPTLMPRLLPAGNGKTCRF